MKTKKHRIVMYAKDVERITGRRPRTCYAILEKVRKFYGKPKDSPVTIREFCKFLQIDEDLVTDFLHE